MKQFRALRGFTLIEILIVIGIFALTTSLVTASYLSFEKSQRLRSAALQLKSDLRLTQNKALSGDKGTGSSSCGSTSTLGGWYLEVTNSLVGDANSKYTIAGNCRTGLSDTFFSSKTIFLPRGVVVWSTSLGTSVDILFRPISSGVTFHQGAFTPPFFNSSGNLLNQIPGGSQLVITLLLTATGDTYQVIVLPSGEINENKP